VAESETALAGLALARLLHLMTGNEGVSLERLLKKEYVALESSNILRGTPNGLLLESEAGGICYLRWVPLGLRRGPCLVFLHGFGGQLTVMVKALIEALPSPPVVILAPYLDTAGQWWLPEGQAVVRELVLHHLPPEADPKQVFLVGLSNGGVGASRLALSESLGPLFKGAILISGLAPPLEDPNNPKSVYEAPVHGADLLVIAGDADPRFPAPLVQSLVDATRRRGSLVELQRLEGDHFIMLSHRKQVGTMIRTWLEPRLLPSVSLGGPLPAEPPVIPRPAE
jgi:predicted esterase